MTAKAVLTLAVNQEDLAEILREKLSFHIMLDDMNLHYEILSFEGPFEDDD